MISTFIIQVLAVSQDCPNVISLAAGLQMQSLQPLIMSQLQTDCCSSSGVSCSGTPLRVIEIYWESMNLAGSINGSALPSALQRLYLRYNNIGGPIPDTFPSTLSAFSFYVNRMTGEIPPLPLQMRSAEYGSNQFSGSFPLLNEGLQNLNMWNAGSIRGGVSSFPSTMQGINIGYMSLNGTVPTIPIDVIHFYIYLNQFSGVVAINRPTFLHVDNNKLTAVLVADTSVLGSCDISNNMIYSDTVQYLVGKCAMNSLLSRPITTAFPTTIAFPTTTAGAFPTTITEMTVTTTAAPTTTVAALLTSEMLLNTETNATMEVKSPTLDAYQGTPISVTIAVSLFGVFRMIVDMMVLTYVLIKTPFTNKQRELIRSYESKRSYIASRNSRGENQF